MRYSSRNALICWALATASPLALSGQGIPDRRFLDKVPTQARTPATGPRPQHPQQSSDRVFVDSLFSDLRRATTVSALPALRCTTRGKSLARLCNGLVALRRAEITDSADDAHRADNAIQRLLLDQPKSAIAWYALGISRLQLVRVHALAREGPLQPVGVSNEAAAGYALVHALELDLTLVPAAEALALGALPPPREGASRLGERVRMLRRVRPLLSATALYGAGRVELEGGNPDSAVADLRLSLVVGDVDSGLVELALARAEYKGGHPEPGRAAFLAGAADTSSEARRAYREQLSWVASPAEMTLWDSLSSNRQTAWLRDFWAKRDVAEGHPDGARLIEHFRRYEFALRDYRVFLPGTGRHRNVQNQDTFTDGMVGAIRANQHTGLGSTNPDTEAVILSASAKLIAFDRDNRLYGVGSPFRFLPLTQDILDDRGIVFMRHGKPDHVAGSAAGGAAMEVWVYDLPDGPLTLQFMNQDFSSSVDATLLVPTLVTGNATTRDHICHLAVSLCPLAIDWSATSHTAGLPLTLAEVGQGMMSSDRVKAAHDIGAEQITQATTTDNFTHRFKKALHPLVQMYGLERTGGGSRIVVAFAIPGAELDAAATSVPGGTTVYDVRFEAVAEAHRSGRRFEFDTVRHFVASRPLLSGEYLSGVLDVAIDPGLYGASVVVSQTSGRGAVAHLSDLNVPVAQPGLTVSDLVLGRESSGVHWNSGTAIVALNPLNTFPRDGQAAVYFQVAGLLPGTSYQTRFEFFRAGDDSKHPPQLAIAFDQVATRVWSEVSRTLDLHNLEPGAYRVRLTLSASPAEATATAWLTIVR